jgi:hypothetical protein
MTTNVHLSTKRIKINANRDAKKVDFRPPAFSAKPARILLVAEAPPAPQEVTQEGEAGPGIILSPALFPCELSR